MAFSPLPVIYSTDSQRHFYNETAKLMCFSDITSISRKTVSLAFSAPPLYTTVTSWKQSSPFYSSIPTSTINIFSHAISDKHTLESLLDALMPLVRTAYPPRPI